MATVVFPASLINLLSRASGFSRKSTVKVDITSDGSPRMRTIQAVGYTRISCRFESLDVTEKDTLIIFINDNGANTITWSIDGVGYSGVIEGGYSLVMKGNRFDISFIYYARVA